MDNVGIKGGDGKIDYDVQTEEDAINLVMRKTDSSENAYEWNKDTKSLIEKPPAPKYKEDVGEFSAN